MKSPRVQAWSYVIAGVVAIGLAALFLSIQGSIFDWFIMAMGVVAIVQGIREFRALGSQDEPKA